MKSIGIKSKENLARGTRTYHIMSVVHFWGIFCLVLARERNVLATSKCLNTFKDM